MKGRIGTVAVGLAAVAALIAVPAALAAYSSPKLEVTPDGDRASTSRPRSSPNDDPTASVRDLSRRRGRSSRRTRRRARCSGRSTRSCKALDLAGADLPHRRASSSSRLRARCPQPRSRAVHRGGDAARDLGDGAERRRDRRCPFPLYLVPTAGAQAALGPAYIADLPPAARRRRRNTRPIDVRREGVQRRAHHQRRLQPRCRSAHGSRSGRRTRPERARPTRPARVVAPGRDRTRRRHHHARSGPARARS